MFVCNKLVSLVLTDMHGDVVQISYTTNTPNYQPRFVVCIVVWATFL